MSTTVRGRRYCIVDDFLPASELAAVRELARGLTYEARDSVVDPVADGSALRSRGAVLRRDEVLGQAGVPAAYRRVVGELADHEDLVGTAGEDWSLVGMAFWKYLAGNRLGWHNDARPDRRGEFILFLHEEWSPSWGGELLVLDRDPDDLPPAPPELPTFAAIEHQVGETRDALVAVVPRPNRLVVVQEGTSHCIHRVDRTAGDHERWTMTGFVGSELAESPRVQDRSRLERLAPFLAPTTPAPAGRQ